MVSGLEGLGYKCPFSNLHPASITYTLLQNLIISHLVTHLRIQWEKPYMLYYKKFLIIKLVY